MPRCQAASRVSPPLLLRRRTNPTRLGQNVRHHGPGGHPTVNAFPGPDGPVAPARSRDDPASDRPECEPLDLAPLADRWQGQHREPPPPQRPCLAFHQPPRRTQRRLAGHQARQQQRRRQLSRIAGEPYVQGTQVRPPLPRHAARQAAGRARGARQPGAPGRPGAPEGGRLEPPRRSRALARALIRIS